MGGSPCTEQVLGYPADALCFCADMSPRFSIITVCMNARSVLPRAIASLQDQTCQDFEWVVIDGGSVDGTFALVQNAPVPLGAWACEPDHGVYDAMNKGLRLARGQWIFFLNADDALHDPNVLRDVAARLDGAPGVGFWWGDVVVRSPRRDWLMRFSHIHRWSLPFEFLCHQGVFAHRRVFDAVGNFRLQWHTSADYDWCLRVFRSRVKTRYLRRVVAEFYDGGMHTRDPAGRELEREVLRLQYLHPWWLAVGTGFSRVVHKACRVLRRGYAWGEHRL